MNSTNHLEFVRALVKGVDEATETMIVIELLADNKVVVQSETKRITVDGIFKIGDKLNVSGGFVLGKTKPISKTYFIE